MSILHPLSGPLNRLNATSSPRYPGRKSGCRKGGGCGLGGVCRNRQNRQNRLEGRVAIPASLGSMSAVIAAGKKPPKPSN